jgi:CRP-like cAMP-binding protein
MEERLSELAANRERIEALMQRIHDRRASTIPRPAPRPAPHITRGNRLLDALPAAEWEHVEKVLRPVRLERSQILCTAGSPCTYAYFPTGGVISLVWLTESGKSVEVLAVGRDGFAGVPFVLGADNSPHWWHVTVGGNAWRAAPADLIALLRELPIFRQLLMDWANLQFVEMSQAVACRRVHTIEHQVARWLLAMRDRSGSANLHVTHDSIAEMLGTRRAGVSVVMEGFRQDGLVSSRRGQVRILDSARLRRVACECYDVFNRELEELFRRHVGAA